MTVQRTTRAALMGTTAAITMFAAGAALAQAAPAQSAADQAASTALGEVVVTATRQVNTVDRVALSMTASTQKTLDVQGVRDIVDIARTTPGLTIRRSDNANTQPSIRGIISSNGSPTTGIYLDDTALQKFNGIGATVGNGSGVPPLFDLDRVEVLRGPQGTLYGGASEGGTIRFITPQPNMNKYSGYVRTQASTTEGGDPSYEGGVAIGGPIIADKVGFRISVFDRHVGGYIDHIDQYTGQQVSTNTDTQDIQAVRAAFAWNVTPDFRLTPAVYGSVERHGDNASNWLNTTSGTTVPTRYWTIDGKETTAGAANVHYSLPAYTYGPYNFFGPGKSGGGITSPSTTRMFIPTLNADYDLHWFQVKSITSYLEDEQRGVRNDFPDNNITALNNGVKMLYILPNQTANFRYSNQRRAISEEIRLSSAPSESKLTWVGGLYYIHSTIHAYNYTNTDLETLSQKLRGVSATIVFGAPDLPGNVATIRDQVIVEEELAGFGQATYSLTSKFKITAGARVSHNTMTYDYLNIGPVAGYNVATTANGGISSGSTSETPVTPKIGFEYQLTDRNLLYFNAAEGFRKGGVNLNMPLNCAASLAALGSAPPAPTYKSDSTWSYEVGAKLRLFDNRAQVNASVFYTNWKDIQTSVSLPAIATGPSCIYNWSVNSGKAISQGGDIQANVRIFPGLVGSFAAAYTDAHYVGDFRAPAQPGKTPGLLVGNGNPLPTPPWSVVIGLQYDHNLWDKYSGYVRADYQFNSAYKSGLGPGTTSYNPDSYISPQTRYVSMRAGVAFDGFDVSAFVNNLTNSQDEIGLAGGGRSGCSDAKCTTYTRYNPGFQGYFFRPREIGVAVAYRF